MCCVIKIVERGIKRKVIQDLRRMSQPVSPTQMISVSTPPANMELQTCSTPSPPPSEMYNAASSNTNHASINMSKMSVASDQDHNE